MRDATQHPATPPLGGSPSAPTAAPRATPPPTPRLHAAGLRGDGQIIALSGRPRRRLVLLPRPAAPDAALVVGPPAHQPGRAQARAVHCVRRRLGARPRPRHLLRRVRRRRPRESIQRAPRASTAPRPPPSSPFTTCARRRRRRRRSSRCSAALASAAALRACPAGPIRSTCTRSSSRRATRRARASTASRGAARTMGTRRSRATLTASSTSTPTFSSWSPRNDGKGGPRTTGSPATGKNTLVVGASLNAADALMEACRGAAWQPSWRSGHAGSFAKEIGDAACAGTSAPPACDEERVAHFSARGPVGRRPPRAAGLRRARPSLPPPRAAARASPRRAASRFASAPRSRRRSSPASRRSRGSILSTAGTSTARPTAASVSSRRRRCCAR